MAWYDTDWAKRRKLTIAAAEVSEALSNYPAYVDLRECGDVLQNIRPDANDLVFTAGDGQTVLAYEIVRQKILGQGATTWFSNPRAIYQSSTKKLITGYVRGDAVGLEGEIRVVSYAHDTGETVEATLRAAGWAIDDHNNPCFCELSDGRILAGYTEHNSTDGVFVRKSTNVGDVSAWGAEVKVFDNAVQGGSSSYCNLFRLSEQSNRIFCFWREGSSLWYYATSDDDGATWSARVALWDPIGGAEQPYIVFSSNGVDRIDLFATLEHPNQAGNSSLYHFYYEFDATGKWFKTDGTEIPAASLPFDGADVTLVYDGSAASDCWVWAIDYQANGAPHVLFATFTSGSEQTDHRYQYSRWDGSAWTAAVQICTAGASLYAGEIYYSGGLCFDGIAPTGTTITIYLSRVETRHEVQKWQSTNSGATWAKVADITSNSESGMFSFRPFSPKNYPAYSPMNVLFSSGTYNSFTDYNTYLCAWPGAPVEAHVKVPSVSDSVDTDIYLYYSNPAATDQSDAAAVWDANYKMVHHLNHRPGTITFADSTSNVVTATKDGTGIQEPESHVGLMGGAVAFTGAASAGHLTLGTQINMAGWTGLTIEAVINYDGGGVSGSERVIFSNNSITEASALMRIEPGSTPAQQLECFITREANTQIGGEFDTAIGTGTLKVVGMTFDSATLKAFVSGAQEATTYAGASAMDATASPAGFIGAQNASTDAFDGRIEEIRISDTARSAAWMALTAATFEDFASVITVGDEEIKPPTLRVVQSGLRW